MIVGFVKRENSPPVPLRRTQVKDEGLIRRGGNSGLSLRNWDPATCVPKKEEK
jgi:hypothetical protein